MGWTCTKAAADTEARWTAACVKQTGSQNTFEVNGQRYFFETSRTEHADGAITGTVHRMCSCAAASYEHTHDAGGFRINGDGSVARAPKWLKDLTREFSRMASRERTPKQVIDGSCWVGGQTPVHAFNPEHGGPVWYIP